MTRVFWRDLTFLRYVPLQIFILIGWITIFYSARADSLNVLIGTAGVCIILIASYLILGRFGYHLPDWSLWSTLVVISVIQNPLIGLLVSDQVTHDKGKILIGLQFLFILLLLGLSLLRSLFQRRTHILLTAADCFALLLIAFMTVIFIISDSPIASRLANMRNLVGGALVYLMARHILDVPPNWKQGIPTPLFSQLYRFVSFLSVIVVIVATLGIVEYIADLLWETKDFYLYTLNAEKVFLAKLGYERIPFGVYDTYLFDIRFNRLLTVFYEAINASYFFAATTMILWVFKRPIAATISAVALLLTFGKGGFLILVVTVYVYLLERLGLPRVLKLLGYTLPVIGYVILAFVSIFLVPTSATSHYLGLSYGFRYALTDPLGAGIGAGGVRGALENITFYEGGGESGVGFMLFTTGFLGFGIWFAWMLSLFCCLWKTLRATTDRLYHRVVIVVLGMTFALTLVTFLQENALSTSANYLYFIFIGLIIREAVNRGHLTGMIRLRF